MNNDVQLQWVRSCTVCYILCTGLPQTTTANRQKICCLQSKCIPNSNYFNNIACNANHMTVFQTGRAKLCYTTTGLYDVLSDYVRSEKCS